MGPCLFMYSVGCCEWVLRNRCRFLGMIWWANIENTYQSYWACFILNLHKLWSTLNTQHNSCNNVVSQTWSTHVKLLSPVVIAKRIEVMQLPISVSRILKNTRSIDKVTTSWTLKYGSHSAEWAACKRAIPVNFIVAAEVLHFDDTHVIIWSRRQSNINIGLTIHGEKGVAPCRIWISFAIHVVHASYYRHI